MMRNFAIVFSGNESTKPHLTILFINYFKWAKN